MDTMQMRKKFLTIITILVVTVLLFAGIDFVLTACGLDPISMKRGAQRFMTGQLNPVYHHEFRPNLDDKAAWGPLSHRLCTNEYGFKTSCDKKKQRSGKSFDIAFIGDSFTEGIGLSYEDSFVGRYADKHPELSVVNLAYRSYSPIIYFKKLEYLLKQGFKFKHVVVLPDISDIQDEAVCYRLDQEKGTVAGLPTCGHRFTESPPLAAPKNIWDKHFKTIWYINVQLYALFHPEDTLESFDSTPGRSNWTTNFDMPGFGDIGVRGGIALAVGHMHDLKKLLDAHGIKMTVVVYPWPAQLMHAAPGHPGVAVWRDFCEREKCANFIDTNDFFFEEVRKHGLLKTIKKYYISRDAHFNAEGNKVLFEAIDGKLVP